MVVDDGGWGSGGILLRWNPRVGSEVFDPKVVEFLCLFFLYLYLRRSFVENESEVIKKNYVFFSSNANGGSSFRDS